MYLKVRVLAGAKRESLKVVSADHFEIAVKEPAENNRANRRVLELVREHYAPGVKQVRIISGHQSPGKILSVEIIAEPTKL